MIPRAFRRAALDRLPSDRPRQMPVYRLHIAEYENRILSVALHDLLEVLEESAAPLHWSVFHLYGHGPDALDLEEASSVEHGLRLRHADLTTLREGFEQIYDGLFVGCASERNVPFAPDLSTNPPADCPLVLDVVDSTFWVVSTRSERDVAALCARFRSATSAS